LKSSLECIKRIDKKIDRESSKRAGLEMVVRWTLHLCHVSGSLTIRISVELFPAICLGSCRDVQQVYNKLDGFTNVEWVLKYRSIFQSRMHHAVIGLLFLRRHAFWL